MRRRRGRARQVVSTSRIEAFSDGVFAIAITLLILEIRVPNPAGGAAHAPLAASLLAIWPSYVGYVISFLVVGIYWANHHYLLRLFRGTSHVLNLLNLHLLFWICFLPFPTAVLSGYMKSPADQRTAVLFYAFGLAMPAFAWCGMWLYAVFSGMVDEQLDPAFVRLMTRQYVFSVVVFAANVGIAWMNALAALVTASTLTLLYLLPPRVPQYRTGAASSIASPGPSSVSGSGW